MHEESPTTKTGGLTQATVLNQVFDEEGKKVRISTRATGLQHHY